MPEAQCPSTKGERAPTSARELSRVGGTGQKLWRSLDEVSDTPAFREFVEREFPKGASELLGESRREFIKLMGAGLALAGAATIPGCRRPDHKILAYSKDVPESSIPGKPIYYATSMPLPGGGVEGLIVETHDFRPTKVEGNPLHPLNQGKSSVWAQTSVLGLYDPDRLKHPVYRESTGADAQAATWDDFKFWWNDRSGLAAKYNANGGRGLAFLVNKKPSPSRDYVRAALMQRFPNAIFTVHEPGTADAPIRGSQIALGRPMREQFDLKNASTIVSIGRDFLNATSMTEPSALVNARDFASTRRVSHSGEAMSRLYVCETGFTVTGGSADHRKAMSPSELARFAVALARQVVSQLGGGGELGSLLSSMDVGEPSDAKFVEIAARDLVEHQGASLVMAGPSLPAELHALVHALNRLLGNVGRTVGYQPHDQADDASLCLEGLSTIAGAIEAGAVETLVSIDVNPVYDAPGEMGFAALFESVPNTITLSVPTSETAAASKWALNGTHYLESWGDTRSIDGTVAPIQPMIAPLFDPAMSEIEFLAWLSGDAQFVEQPAPVKDEFGRVIPEGELPDTNGGGGGHVTGRQVVQAAWKSLGFVGGRFDLGWKRSLHDGIVRGTGGRSWTDGGVERAALFSAVRNALGSLSLDAMPSEESLAVVIETGHVADGRFANDAWLQELPNTGTRVVWDNPILLSPATAKALGVMPDPYTSKEPEGRIISLTHEGRQVEAPVWILPGMADNCAIVTLGYGRTRCGAVGDEVGDDMNPLRGRDGAVALAGAKLTKTGKSRFIASTQNHWSLEGRDSIVRQLDKNWFDAHADTPIEAQKDHIYGRFEKKLNLAEQLGELSHTPPNVSAYDNPFNESPEGPTETAEYAKGPQWGMSIDLSTCTGCGVCTIACQAENNIAVVGKKESGKGREMHWIRVDRYFTGDDPFHPEEMIHQPVPCVQSENAPCETVCPVNATSHGPEGINHMAYNRCIGTRYCANNCPYKVRRFNWMDYGQVAFNGGYVGEESLSAVGMNPENQNLIPARLRARLDEISKLQRNPDVTVRGRGVMEKCNYCVQRINAARYEMKLQDLERVPDGFFQSACQQACPSNAIVFGDLMDEASQAREARDNPRSYLLLGFLNTRPRTTHMIRVRNPHPDLIDEARRTHDPLAHGGGHGAGHSDSTGHDDDHNGEHGPGDDDSGHDEGGEHSFLHNPRRSVEDKGYSLSLKVLGSATGVTA